MTEIYFITDTVVDWVDVFTRPIYKQIIVDSLKFCQQEKGLSIHAWVLMSNHFHAIVSSKSSNKISDILRDFKKFTSKEIVKAILEYPQESRKKWLLNRFEYAGRDDNKITNYKFWQDGNDAQLLFSDKFIMQKLNYIHQNPVRAQIVSKAEDYLYSSAMNYAGAKGLIDIEFYE